MVELCDRCALRKTLELMEKFWRPGGAFRPDPTTGQTVRLLCFGGDIYISTGVRCLSNKSVTHGAVLTDQVYRVNVYGDGINASTSGAIASQAVSRICGVHSHTLNSNPAIWCTSDTKDWPF